MQDNLGRRTFSTFFKPDRSLDLMTFNFENAASHKNVVQTYWRLRVARSEMTGHSFLVLKQKWHKLCFENSSCKFFVVYNSVNELWLTKICPERANHTFLVTLWFLPKFRFLSQNFGSRYDRKPIKGSNDSDCSVVPKNVWAKKSGWLG